MFELVSEVVASAALRGNPLGDPSERELALIAPRGAVADRVPLVLALAGYSGTGRSLLVHHPWSEGLLQRMNRLAANGLLGPMIVALPDCFTRYGGSQYLNSAATGAYEDYLWQDLVPAIRRRYPIGRIGVLGKSSGGYGALVQAMRQPAAVSAAAVHSGDMYFEYCFLRDFPRTARELRDGGVAGLMRRFEASADRLRSPLLPAVEILAMAACYSPSSDSPDGFDLPFVIETGALRNDVWQRWLEHDPVRMIEREDHASALRGLRLLYLDCGTADEYGLDAGARIFTHQLARRGIAFQHEEFDDGHSAVQYRYDRSLPALWAALRA